MDPIEIFNTTNLKYIFWFASAITFFARNSDKGKSLVDRVMSSLFAGLTTGVISIMIAFTVGLAGKFLLTKERPTNGLFVADYEHCKTILQREIKNENLYLSVNDAPTEEEAIRIAKTIFLIDSQKEQRLDDWETCKKDENRRVQSTPGFTSNKNGVERVWIWE